jgi:hypothetical protein
MLVHVCLITCAATRGRRAHWDSLMDELRAGGHSVRVTVVDAHDAESLDAATLRD